MDSLNTDRQGLLLELVRNITQLNIPGYSDKAIVNRVIEYKDLLNEFNSNMKGFPFAKKTRLAELHQYFYGTEFNFENPDDTEEMVSTNIYEDFKQTFKKIEDLAGSDEELREQLRKSLNDIMGTVGYSKKDKEFLDYLNIIIQKAKGIKTPSNTLKKEIVQFGIKPVERKVGDTTTPTTTQTSPLTTFVQGLQPNAPGFPTAPSPPPPPPPKFPLKPSVSNGKKPPKSGEAPDVSAFTGNKKRER